MGTTVTATTGVVHPFSVVETLRTEQEARSVMHDILDGPPVFTLRDAGPRTATLKLLVSSDTDAETLRVIFATGQVATVIDPSRPTLISPVTLTGKLSVGVDKKTARTWIIEAEVTEVPA